MGANPKARLMDKKVATAKFRSGPIAEVTIPENLEGLDAFLCAIGFDKKKPPRTSGEFAQYTRVLMDKMCQEKGCSVDDLSIEIDMVKTTLGIQLHLSVKSNKG